MLRYAICRERYYLYTKLDILKTCLNSTDRQQRQKEIVSQQRVSGITDAHALPLSHQPGVREAN